MDFFENPLNSINDLASTDMRMINEYDPHQRGPDNCQRTITYDTAKWLSSIYRGIDYV